MSSKNMAPPQPPQGSNANSSPLIAANHQHDGKKHLLLAASGSVATIKIPNIVTALSQFSNLSIRIIVTASASQFLAGQSREQPSLASLSSLPNVDGIYHDEDEWAQPWTRGAGILHIELRRWADILVVAPLSANTLAKMVGGFADNLLLSVIRAWDTTGLIDERGEGGKKRIVVAPAMNTAMWRHPITKRQIKVLETEWGVDGAGWVEVLWPQEKELACGDVGDGAMKDWKEIVSVIEQRLALKDQNS
jgi:phosphopantothenoylcysteine decarboxylase